MRIEIEEVRRHTIEIEDDDTITLNKIDGYLISRQIEGDTLHARLTEVCQWDPMETLTGVLTIAEQSGVLDTEIELTVDDWDLDGIEPVDEDEDEDESDEDNADTFEYAHEA